MNSLCSISFFTRLSRSGTSADAYVVRTKPGTARYGTARWFPVIESIAIRRSYSGNWRSFTAAKLRTHFVNPGLPDAPQLFRTVEHRNTITALKGDTVGQSLTASSASWHMVKGSNEFHLHRSAETVFHDLFVPLERSCQTTPLTHQPQKGCRQHPLARDGVHRLHTLKDAFRAHRNHCNQRPPVSQPELVPRIVPRTPASRAA